MGIPNNLFLFRKKDDELMRTEQDLLLFERQDHRRRTFKYWKSKLEKHQKDFKIFINNKRYLELR